MTRLTILIVALLFVAHTCCASKSQERQESCEKQLQRVNLKQCEKHVMERVKGCHDEDDDDEADVLTTVRGRINYIRKGEKEKEKEEDDDERVQKCCSEMSELSSPKCQCRALQKMMERQSEKLEKKEKLLMEMELMSLATTCGLGPLIGCDLRCED